MKILAVVAAVTVLAAGGIGYKLTHKGPPSFRRGGEFAVAGPPISTTSSSVETVESTSSSVPAAQPVSPAPTASSATTATTRTGSAATSPTTRAAAATTTTRAASGPAPTAPKPVPPTPPPAQQPAGPGKPAVGTYTYTVDGTEGASFVGTRKMPSTMTMVVHAGPGVAADQLVFDITYSDKHAEREIVGFRNDGVYFDFEGGSVTFGPRTETSQADYQPPILQVPLPLQAGLSRTGVSKAQNADGSLSRTEDWKATVLGQEAVTVGGATVNAWKIDLQRKFRPGTPDQGYRNRTYWFDPARNIWVKYTEVFHGERHVAVGSFSYDSNITATLASFAA